MPGSNSGLAMWLSSCRRYALQQHRLHFWGTLIVLVVFFIFMMAMVLVAIVRSIDLAVCAVRDKA